MAKGACKKCGDEEECECPEWIFTFADLVMLMMGFFVILWVLKPAPGKEGNAAADEKWMDTVAGIRTEFGWTPDDRSIDPIDMREILKRLKQLKPHQGQGQGGETSERREGARGTDELVETIRKANQATEGGKLVFDRAQATLRPAILPKLDEIAHTIEGHNNIILVKGHTALDDYPDGASDSVKMDLSLRRAQAVADYLIAHKVDRKCVRVQGCSTFEPVVQGVYAPDAQEPNRRVEIEAMAMLAQDFRPPPSTAPSNEPAPATAP